MYLFQKAAATGRNNTNVSGRVVTWNVCSLVSCHLQPKHYDYILSVTPWFLFSFHQYEYERTSDSLSSRVLPLPSARFLSSLGSEPRCGDTLSLFRGAPAFYICVCVCSWVGVWESPGSVGHTWLPTHTHTYALTHIAYRRRVVNISWAAVYFTTFLSWMWRSPLTLDQMAERKPGVAGGSGEHR